MKKYFLPLCLIFLLLLAACGKPAAQGGEEEPTPSPSPAQVSPEPEPEPEPTEPGLRNPLTGLPIDEKLITARPLAIMLNNLKVALPQLGVSQADIIYEVLAEGGITRMLGLFQTVEGVGQIGSVRSSRTYYIELALGHDALYIHAGGSPDAYDKLKEWKVDALDAVNGPYTYTNTIFWRDAERRASKGFEHSLITSGDALMEYLPELTSFRREHAEGYEPELIFAEDGTPESGESALIVSVPFSAGKTGVFTYDAETKLYMVRQDGRDYGGKNYVDGNNDTQVGVTNVIILKTDCHVIKGDTEGRLEVDLTSGGEGFFACGGKIIPIRWAKGGPRDPFVYTTMEGEAVTLGVGRSYVNIIPLSNDITAE